MNTLGKSILIAAAAATLSVASITPASADDWHHHGYNGWAVGAAGLATGLIVGSAIASQPRYAEPGYYYGDYPPPPPPPYYYRAPQRVYVEPSEAYYPGPAYELRPWSPQWMRYCSDRYQTFDGRTGTYVGYDGARHFCTAG